MLCSIENVEELSNLNNLVSLQSQVKEIRLQDKLGKENYHENIRKLYEPLNDTIKNTSENLSKTRTETSNKNNKVLENSNTKLSDRDCLQS